MNDLTMRFNNALNQLSYKQAKALEQLNTSFFATDAEFLAIVECAEKLAELRV